jgi:hypothetical protein
MRVLPLADQAPSRGTTITGASTPARIRAAVDPRKIRRGAANRLEPTTRMSDSSQYDEDDIDARVEGLGERRSQGDPGVARGCR